MNMYLDSGRAPANTTLIKEHLDTSFAGDVHAMSRAAGISEATLRSALDGENVNPKTLLALTELIGQPVRQEDVRPTPLGSLSHRTRAPINVDLLRAHIEIHFQGKVEAMSTASGLSQATVRRALQGENLNPAVLRTLADMVGPRVLQGDPVPNAPQARLPYELESPGSYVSAISMVSKPCLLPFKYRGRPIREFPMDYQISQNHRAIEGIEKLLQPTGEVHALVGPSGSGKSTFVCNLARQLLEAKRVDAGNPTPIVALCKYFGQHGLSDGLLEAVRRTHPEYAGLEPYSASWSRGLSSPLDVLDAQIASTGAIFLVDGAFEVRSTAAVLDSIARTLQRYPKAVFLVTAMEPAQVNALRAVLPSGRDLDFAGPKDGSVAALASNYSISSRPRSDQRDSLGSATGLFFGVANENFTANDTESALRSVAREIAGPLSGDLSVQKQLAYLLLRVDLEAAGNLPPIGYDESSAQRIDGLLASRIVSLGLGFFSILRGGHMVLHSHQLRSFVIAEYLANAVMHSPLPDNREVATLLGVLKGTMHNTMVFRFALRNLAQKGATAQFHQILRALSDS